MIAPETVYLAADTNFRQRRHHRTVRGDRSRRHHRRRRGDPFVLPHRAGIDRQEGVGRSLCAVAAGDLARRRRADRQFRRDQSRDRSRPASRSTISAYIGDAHVGANTNIGAGTITCNYDGLLKHKTIDRRGRLRRHQFLAGGAGENRQRRLYRLRLGDHQRRARRCVGGGAHPAKQPRGRRQAIPRNADAGQEAEGWLADGFVKLSASRVIVTTLLTLALSGAAKAGPVNK